jgi:Protein of unknown function (DUF2690)
MRSAVALRAPSLRGLSLRAALGAVLLLCAGLAAAPAAHAASCSYDNCKNVDPQSTDCRSDARNVDSFVYGGSDPGLAGALLELRYSPSCHAAWVRTTGGNCFQIWVPCVAGMQSDDGTLRLTTPSGDQHWTTMESFHRYVRGCFYHLDAQGEPSTRDGCTAWH